MYSVCNETKWRELRDVMIEYPPEVKPSWRTKDLNGFIYVWDRDWFYHFRRGEYKTIEYCETLTNDVRHMKKILKYIESINLCGIIYENIIRVYGYVNQTGDVNILNSAQQSDASETMT